MRAPLPRPLPLVVLSLCLMLGCEQGGPTPPDAGTEDAGGGSDAGPLPADGGSSQDAGTQGDGGTSPDGGTEATPCGVPFFGDPNGTPTFTLTALAPDGTYGLEGANLKSVPLTEKGSLSVLLPPQGGRVVFIGVKGVNNMNPCGIKITGGVRDTKSQLVQIDSRQFNLLPGPDGLGMSDDKDIFTFSNVTLCPNNWSERDLFDEEYGLTLILEDRAGRKVTRFLDVRLECNEPTQAAECRCICRKGYRLGDSCSN